MNRPKKVRTLCPRMFSCRLLAPTLAIAALSVVFAGSARAATSIDPGYMLFHTVPVSSIYISGQTIDFVGYPLDTFDFGSGPVNVGNADTIVERLGTANLGGGSDTVDIELVALSLVSAIQVDLGFGAGLEDIFITLDGSSPSLQSTMTITDTGEGQPHGTFDAINNFTFDVTGSVGGYYTTGETTVSITSQEWQHAPTGSLVISGVNHLLNGADESNDFWPNDVVVQNDGPGSLVHSIEAANIPEPTTFVLAALGLLSISCQRRYRR